MTQIKIMFFIQNVLISEEYISKWITILVIVVIVLQSKYIDSILLIFQGIPVSQQHLIWKNVELEDDYSLNDYQWVFKWIFLYYIKKELKATLEVF